jgi:hypothetical protein
MHYPDSIRIDANGTDGAAVVREVEKAVGLAQLTDS